MHRKTTILYLSLLLLCILTYPFLYYKALKIHISKQTKDLLEMNDGHQYFIEPRDQKVELKVIFL